MFRTVYIILCFLFFSCSIEKKCARLEKKCPSKTIIRDSVITQEHVVYRDTTIYKTITLYSDTTITDTTINTVHGLIISDTLSIHGNIADAYSWIDKNSLKLRLTEHDTTLLIKLDSVIKENKILKNNYKIITEVKEPIIVKENTSFATFTQ